MGEKASDRIRINRPAADVMGVITDLEHYPEWAEGVTRLDVLSRDDQGRPIDATMYVDAKILELHYTLRYEHHGPNLLTWKLTEGEHLTQLDGSYALSETDGVTEVTYELEIDLQLPMPGFMKKRAAKVILSTGLQGLRDRVEKS